MIYSFRNRKPKIGKDTYVSEQAVLIGDVRIGDSCYIGPGTILRGDYGIIEIGDRCAIEEGVIVHSPPDRKCIIGKEVTIGHGSVIHCSSIGDLSVIGMGAIVSMGAYVGAEAIIAEGSIVKMKQKIPPAVVAVGNPARVIRPITDDDKKFWRHGKQIYVDLAAEYLRNGLKRVDSNPKPESH